MSLPQGALGAICAEYGVSSSSSESDDDEKEAGQIVIVKSEPLDIDPEEGKGQVVLDKGEIETIPTIDLTGTSQGTFLVNPLAVEGAIKKEAFSGEWRDVDEETEDSEPDSAESDAQEPQNKKKGKNRKGKRHSPSSSDDEDWDLSGDGKAKEPPRAKGEMNYQDLPPIEDLHISVPHEKTRPIGVIKSFVDPLVIVEAYPNIPALDIDSVLFLDQGDRALGAIFDVIGQVKQPFYCIRFNSLEHISSKGVEKGMLVYCAPSTPHTSYVLLGQLQQLRGSDASWLNDIEPPKGVNEYSDDEVERANKKPRNRKARRGGVNNNPPGQNIQAFQPQSQPRRQVYAPRNRPPQYRPMPNQIYNYSSRAPYQTSQEYSWHNHRLFSPRQYDFSAPPPPPSQPYYSSPAYRYPHPHVQQPNWNYNQHQQAHHHHHNPLPPPPPPPRTNQSNPPPPGT